MKRILLKLTPYGLSLVGEGHKPLLLLKDPSGALTLPVPLNPLEAGVTLSQTDRARVPTTPHRVSQLLLESMNVKITKCVFQEIVGGRMMVDLKIENHPSGLKHLLVKAEDAMSLCLHLGVPIFATKDFILESRSSVAEMQVEAQNLLMSPKVLQRTHPYLM